MSKVRDLLNRNFAQDGTDQAEMFQLCFDVIVDSTISRKQRKMAIGKVKEAIGYPQPVTDSEIDLYMNAIALAEGQCRPDDSVEGDDLGHEPTP